jgi:hypothetical protein
MSCRWGKVGRGREGKRGLIKEAGEREKERPRDGWILVE